MAFGYRATITTFRLDVAFNCRILLSSRKYIKQQKYVSTKFFDLPDPVLVFLVSSEEKDVYDT